MDVRVITYSDNYVETVSFLTELLGLQLMEAWDDEGGRGTLLRVHGALLEVQEVAEAVPPAGVELSVEADDVDSLHRALVDRNVSMLEDIGDRPWGHRTFTLEAPHRLRITFFTRLIADVSTDSGAD